MGREETLNERVRNKPKDLSFSEMQTWLNHNGFILDRSKGSHFIFKKGPHRINITSPHGKLKNKCISKYQISQAIDAVDKSLDD